MSNPLAMQPIRVLHVFGRMHRGGAEMRTLDLMRHVDPLEFTLEFCTLSGLPGSLDDEIRSLGGKVHPCPLNVGFPSRFKRLLRDQHIDVVHSHVHLFTGYILRLAAQAGVKVRIAHFRSTDDGNTRSLRRWAQSAVMRRWVDRFATHILGVSRAALEIGWRADFALDRRCRVIYNGLDVRAYDEPADRVGLRAELQMPSDAEIVIHVGNMGAAKNHARLIDVFVLLAAHQPSAYLVLVGRTDPAIASAVTTRAAEAGLRESVRILGERSDVPRLLRAADVMVYPSQREGLPGAVLEACAAGLPVVASALPGIIEIATELPGVTTLSLDDRDETWAAAAEAALAIPVVATDLVKATDRFAASPFALDACVRAMTATWSSAWPNA